MLIYGQEDALQFNDYHAILRHLALLEEYQDPKGQETAANQSDYHLPNPVQP